MKVVVGSQNPVKKEAVFLGFSLVWPEEIWEVIGTNVSSGVSDQPMSDEESITGARNRAERAIAQSGADYSVGLEGGLHRIGLHCFDCGWIVVRDRHGNEGIGSTARILTPPSIFELVERGMELGVANDTIFGAINSKQVEGHFGSMTNGLITRSAAYRDGVIVALSRFIHPHLF